MGLQRHRGVRGGSGSDASPLVAGADAPRRKCRGPTSASTERGPAVTDLNPSLDGDQRVSAQLIDRCRRRQHGQCFPAFTHHSRRARSSFEARPRPAHCARLSGAARPIRRSCGARRLIAVAPCVAAGFVGVPRTAAPQCGFSPTAHYAEDGAAGPSPRKCGSGLRGAALTTQAADRANAPRPQAGTAKPEPRPGGHRRRRSAARVRAGLRDGSVPVDAYIGRLQYGAGETCVVAPARFEPFAAGRDLVPATVRNRVVGLHARTAMPVPNAFVQAGAWGEEPCIRTRAHPRGRASRRPLTQLRQREIGGGAIRQATYAAQSFIRTRRRSNKSLRR